MQAILDFLLMIVDSIKNLVMVIPSVLSLLPTLFGLLPPFLQPLLFVVISIMTLIFIKWVVSL